MIQAVKESLSRKIPAISFGIIGPPEAGIVTGYGEDGNIFYCWSYFQENPARCYQKSDWLEPMSRGLIVLAGKNRDCPPPRQVLVESIEWALDLERTAHRPGNPDHVAGLEAYLVSLVTPWPPWHQVAFTGLAEARSRRTFSRLVRQAKEKETQAVEHLERALASLK